MGIATAGHANRSTTCSGRGFARRVLTLVLGLVALAGSMAPPVSAAPTNGGTWTMPQYRPIAYNWFTDWSTRIWHAATQMRGGAWAGRGLVCGGNDKSAFLLSEYASPGCFTYDATANSWRPVSAASPPYKMMMSLDATADGRAVLFGGTYVATAYPSAETWILAPTSTNAATWTKRTPTVSPPARGGQAHAGLADGRTVIFGGRSRTYSTVGCTLAKDKPGWLPCRLDDTWIYDPNNGPQGTWKQVSTPVAPSKRDFAMMAPYGRGAILVGGGLDAWATGQSPTSDETWFFDPGTVDAGGNVVGASWRPIDVERPADFTPISHGALTALGGGMFLQSAGYVHPYVCQHCAQVRVLDMAASPRPRWDEKAVPPWGGRDYNQGWSAGSGSVVLFGGQGNQNEFSLWRFQLASAVSTPVACNNGLDDDGDGGVDTSDGGCATWTDTNEA